MRRRLFVPFALLVAACSSSPSTSATSAPLESASEERGLASAPIEGRVDGAEDSERDCWCPSVTIRCSGAGNAHARADRASCILDLPARSCALLGLEAGAAIDPEELLRAPLPTDVTGNDVWEVCTARHEARHACDAAEISACGSELNAYDVSLECMKAYASDAFVAFNVENVVAARELNACLCAGTACTTCAARCHADHPTRGATCDQGASVYCP